MACTSSTVRTEIVPVGYRTLTVGLRFTSESHHQVSQSRALREPGLTKLIFFPLSGDVPSVHPEPVQTDQEVPEVGGRVRRGPGQPRGEGRRRAGQGASLRTRGSVTSQLSPSADKTSKQGLSRSKGGAQHEALTSPFQSRLLQAAANAENEDNISEQKRQSGKRVRYGEVIQVLRSTSRS